MIGAQRRRQDLVIILHQRNLNQSDIVGKTLHLEIDGRAILRIIIHQRKGEIESGVFAQLLEQSHCLGKFIGSLLFLCFAIKYGHNAGSQAQHMQRELMLKRGTCIMEHLQLMRGCGFI